MLVEKKRLRIGIGLFLIFLFTFTMDLHLILFGGLMNAIIVLAIAVIIVWNKSISSIRSVRPVVPLVAFMIIMMLHNNQDTAQYGTVLIYNNLFFIIAWISFMLLQPDGEWHDLFCKIVIFFSTIHAIATWFFYLVPSAYPHIVPLFGSWADGMLRQFDRGYAPGLSPTYSLNAIYLGMGACVCMGQYITKKHNLFQLIFLVSAVLLTGKRSQLLATICAFLVVYYFYNSDQKANRIFKLIAIAIVSIIVFLIAAQFVPQLATFINRFQETAEMGDVSLGRFDRFLTSYNVFLENPILGIGWNGSSYYFRELDGIFINVHNIYIQLLMETGIVGSIAYYLFFVSTLIISVKIVSKIKLIDTGKDVAQYCCGSLAIQVFFLLYGITGNPLYDAPALIPYVFASALIYYYYYESKTLSSSSVLAS